MGLLSFENIKKPGKGDMVDYNNREEVGPVLRQQAFHKCSKPCCLHVSQVPGEGCLLNRLENGSSRKMADSRDGN